MAEILDYFDRINIDVAKRKYYNVNKVNTVLEELRGLAEELVEENERQRQELVQLRAELEQKAADGDQSRELLGTMQQLYRDTLTKAHSRADGIVQEAEAHRDRVMHEAEAERAYAEQQVRECFRVLQSREEENLRFLRGYLEQFSGRMQSADPTEEAARPEEPAVEKALPDVSAQLYEKPYGMPVEAEDDEEELPPAGFAQLKDLELQIQRLANEISALESGR